MAWVAVDKDKAEYIYESKPHREEGAWYEHCDFVQLPIGSINKLIGKDLTWDNDPVELK